MAYTLDSKLGDFLKDPKSLGILMQYLEEGSKSPFFEMAKAMSVKDVLALPQVKNLGVTEEMVKTALADVNSRL